MPGTGMTVFSNSGSLQTNQCEHLQGYGNVCFSTNLLSIILLLSNVHKLYKVQFSSRLNDLQPWHTIHTKNGKMLNFLEHIFRLYLHNMAQHNNSKFVFTTTHNTMKKNSHNIKFNEQKLFKMCSEK